MGCRASLRSDFPVLPRPDGRRHPFSLRSSDVDEIPRPPFGSHRRLHGRPSNPSSTSLRLGEFQDAASGNEIRSTEWCMEGRVLNGTSACSDRDSVCTILVPTCRVAVLTHPARRGRGCEGEVQPWRRRWLPKGGRGIRLHPTLLGCRRQPVRGRTGKSDQREDRRVGRTSPSHPRPTVHKKEETIPRMEPISRARLPARPSSRASPSLPA